jgi:hypothetical protein
MKQRLKISVSKKPQNSGTFSYKSVTLREKIMRFLFGQKQSITILVAGDSVKEVDIFKIDEGGVENESC